MDELKQIGKYELREYLGGGMSQVYRAWDPVMNRTVVVKVLTRESAADADSKARFLREAQTAGGLAHDNVIRVYDYGEEEGRPYMVMEYLEGQDLRQAVKSGEAGDLRRRLEIARDAAKALEYIHEQEIIHRDIKPENVHLDRSGRVRLMDFGIAKRPELNLTRTGFTLGTPYYMSPEQVCGESATKSVDIYAFGILLFELLTGSKPFAGDKIEQIFYKILNERVNLAPVREAGAPEAVCDLVARCTAKDAAQRPANMSEVRRILEEALDAGTTAAPAPARTVSESTAAPPPDKAASRHRPVWMVPAGVAVAAGAALVLYSVWLRSSDEAGQAAEPPPRTFPASLFVPSGDMVLVPAGAFLAGPEGRSEQTSAYYIDRTEVTNGAWKAFCEARGRGLPPGFAAERPELPVVNVTIAEAREFAAWADKRLPSALEWEKAARGEDGRPYPWGAGAEPQRANVQDKPGGSSGLVPANSFGSGASPYGVLQMAGNVWELTDEPVTPSAAAIANFSALLEPPPGPGEPWFQMRGGSYNEPLQPNVTLESASVPARFRAPNVGFRCVRDAE